MKRQLAGVFFLLALVPSLGWAQVKRVEMKLDGYLCGDDFLALHTPYPAAELLPQI